jgi:hypothetical protein
VREKKKESKEERERERERERKRERVRQRMSERDRRGKDREGELNMDRMNVVNKMGCSTRLVFNPLN